AVIGPSRGLTGSCSSHPRGASVSLLVVQGREQCARPLLWAWRRDATGARAHRRKPSVRFYGSRQLEALPWTSTTLASLKNSWGTGKRDEKCFPPAFSTSHARWGHHSIRGYTY